ncbi:TOMM precursor leader peptide-binding protein [Kitasatospora sp. NPDC057015]|uniref:TOMM precursor leader peptide-binding protein n=1 Tax=Kitasatospora sp. NPDC057015 TaxID=3346001 RepID=UPI00362A92C2
MAAYEEITDTRPRIRRDVLFSRTPTGVLFHNAHGGFSLTTKQAYRFASLIVPHLNGRNSVAEICQGLGDTQRSMVVELVRALYKRDFARDAGPAVPAGSPGPAPEVASRFAAQIDYVDHYVGEAASRFQRFRETRVAVLGDDPIARWCVLSLVRNGCAEIGVAAGVDRPGNGFGEVEEEAAALTAAGCPVSITRLGRAEGPAGPDPQGPDRVGPAELGWADLDGYDLVVVTGGPDRTGHLARLLAAGIPAGRRLLGAWTIGERAVIGPLMSADTTGCWTCAALRLGANTDPGAAADLWSAVGPLAPLSPGGPRIGRPLAAMIGNLLGYEVFRLTTGALPAETDGRLIIQDLDSLDVVAEPLLPHPRCPRCGDTAVAAAEGARSAAAAGTRDTDARGTETLSTAALGTETLTAAEAFADLTAPGADPESGPLPADGAAEEAAAQAALAELDSRAVLLRPNAGVFTAYADDGWEQTPLKVGTVGLSLGHGARREISAFDVHHVAGARLRALYRAAEVYAEHVVPPTGLLGAAAARAAGSPLVGPRELAIGAGTGAGTEDVPLWAPARSLVGGGPALVPAAALRTFGPYNRDRAFESTGAGTGAAGSPAGATARGLLSALAHDALRRTLRGAPAARIGLDAFQDDAELVFLARSAKNLGLELELLELGAGDGQVLPVALARAVDPGTGHTDWAVAAGLRLRGAALEAARDLLGTVQLGRNTAAGQPDTGDPLVRELAAGALPLGTGAPTDPATALTLPQVLDRLRTRGRDALVAPVAAADLRAGGITVARVLLTDGPTGAR